MGPIWDDPEVTDVLVNGPGVVWVERAGRLRPTELRLSAEELEAWCQRLLHPLSVPLDRAHPVAEARLADGARVAIAIRPVAPGGPIVAMRRPARRALGLADFGPPAVVRLLERVVADRSNVVVAGPTGAGKTALLGALCAGCAAEERLVVIEDSGELVIDGPQVVRLEARDHPAGPIEGIRHLVRAALRLRPDRIVVGEVRGAEALDMIWALSTGHRGSMSTVHADGPADVMARLETMCLLGRDGLPAAAMARQVRSAIDVVVMVARAADGQRAVTGVWGLRVGAAGVELVPEHASMCAAEQR